MTDTVTREQAVEVLEELVTGWRPYCVYEFRWDIKRTFGDVAGWALYRYYTDETEDDARREWDTTDAARAASQWDRILADELALIPLRNRAEEIADKPFKEQTAAERFFLRNWREPTDAELEAERPKPPTDAEWLAQCRAHRDEFMDARKCVLEGDPDIDPEFRAWLESDFDPETEFTLSDLDRGPNLQRMIATIDGAKWLREMQSLQQHVAAVAMAMEIEVSRKCRGIGK